ncbi:MAG: hypothetical protein NC318_09085 [Blautia sp.]|nr:hypothetical protein [Lachnoclostridium sp.]MCM1211744.1 hypothetical protein [Blautia sp.]
MSRLAEELFKIQTYEEFDRRRDEFKELKITEPGVIEHLNKIFPYIGDRISDGIIREVF